VAAQSRQYLLALAAGPQRHPWYPSFTIFRQAQTDDWNEVIAQVRSALQQHLPQH
jgi:hypothetical protein